MSRRTALPLIALLCGALAATSAFPAQVGLWASTASGTPDHGPSHSKPVQTVVCWRWFIAATTPVLRTTYC